MILPEVPGGCPGCRLSLVLVKKRLLWMIFTHARKPVPHRLSHHVPRAMRQTARFRSFRIPVRRARKIARSASTNRIRGPYTVQQFVCKNDRL